tara:strand:- start:306 stop:767 length:462 start_codon:yes stop_codon:yes gene_type:complete
MYSSQKLLLNRYSSNNQFYSITICSAQKATLFKTFNNACIAARGIMYMQNKVHNICYTLMPDHLHWLFQLRTSSLPEVIRQYKSITTIKFNQLNNSSGKIWQQGYFEHKIRAEEDLLNQARYIAANPLRAGIVKKLEYYSFWDSLYLEKSLLK